MAYSGHSSDEDFLESLGISLDTDFTADADTHASVTGIYARTWAFEYFPYTRPELIHADLGLGLVSLAWRWYRSNLHTIRRKKSLRDLKTFFDTCTLEQIQAHPHFQRSDALSRRRVVLSHPILRRYYLGERVDLQIRGCRSVPYPPPEDMRVGKQMTLTDAHTEGVPHVEFILGGDYDEGVVIDWDFLQACIRFWDPEAHVFRFGAMMEEMCPLFKEFCMIIGCDPNAPLVRYEVKIGYMRSFENLFQFSRPQASAMVVDDQKAILLPPIDEFSETRPDDPDQITLSDDSSDGGHGLHRRYCASRDYPKS
ncbi:hypothetical protein JCGZ_07836 [Jatropha curcas]|uniref:Aminotransferase-like plant mobile domain-containing protein n=1 Tax=Jatropha curcas TaxID=180498 RepID=A0A067J984_JATCU|nr:hypothetical protein JCGZ_07836 [Jatropha curcas]